MPDKDLISWHGVQLFKRDTETDLTKPGQAPGFLALGALQGADSMQQDAIFLLAQRVLGDVPGATLPICRIAHEYFC